jgi:hypothetical protein
VRQPWVSSRGSRLAVASGTSSGWTRCGISRIACWHLCRQLVGGLLAKVSYSSSLELGGSRTLLSTRVLFLELGQVVDIVIDNDVQVVGLVVRRNVVGCEGFRHVVLWNGWWRSVGSVERSRSRSRNGRGKHKIDRSRSLTRDQADM